MDIDIEQGNGGFASPSQSSIDKCIPYIKQQTRLCPCQQPFPLQPRLECVYIFLSAKNVPSALSNGRGGGREKKTEIKQEGE